MKEHYLVCNLDKKEYLNHDGPEIKGSPLKLLALLLTEGTPRGSWSGDRIVIIGDYASGRRLVSEPVEWSGLYSYVRKHYRDITDETYGAFMKPESSSPYSGEIEDLPSP